MSELIAFLIYTAILLILVAATDLLCRGRWMDEGASLDRLLAGPQRREYRDAP